MELPCAVPVGCKVGAAFALLLLKALLGELLGVSAVEALVSAGDAGTTPPAGELFTEFARLEFGRVLLGVADRATDSGDKTEPAPGMTGFSGPEP